MTPTAKDVRAALKRLGAIGAEQAVPRDMVINNLARRGLHFETAEPVRALKLVAADTRTAEALHRNPEDAILFCERGYYVPSPHLLAQAHDFETCAQFRQTNLGDSYKLIERLKSVATMCRAQAETINTQASLFS